ncbi:MAG: hypothetical protein ABS882_01405 [Lysinibacillus sp.]
MDLEHPDITHVNRTGYTRDQWHALHKGDVENDNENDRSEIEHEKTR